MQILKNADKYRATRDARKDAEDQEQHEQTPQTLSPSFRLAFTDQDFLLHDALRPVRLQLELLKPEMRMQEQNIQSTVVVFGSARTPTPEQANQEYEQAEQLLTQNPDDDDAKRTVARAKKRQEHAGYYQQAREFARIVSNANLATGRSNFVIKTGGGPGIMEAANRGAHDVGSKSLGLAIALPKEEKPNAYVTPELCFQFHYFAIRKMHFLMRAVAMVAFPGGFGTFDELFESLTLMQTGRIKRMPILLFGTDYWKRVVNFEALADEQVISDEDLNMFIYVDDAQEAWEHVRQFYAKNAD